MTTTIERAIHALENNVGEMRVEGALNILRAALAAPAAAPSAKAKKPRLNSAAFMTALVAAANARKMTMRDVSMATGVNETTLSRMKGGERACDAASFSALATWAGLNPQDFYLPSTAPATAPARPAPERKPMTDEEVIDLVRECGLDWHKGFMPLFDDDPTNRFAVLVSAVEAFHGILPTPKEK